ncbi:amidohydrolase family protein [Granulicella sibirica]|uniref:Xaa-Pro dipeptidase n=1 Tax=Granulicella sibirica TaxID=2479048 RepID=A0A4Q0T6T6_9BACT|nr:amidohydrolase family protein [Granulicella sibirica]RXH58380.1 Xaa-Pro dipeptidase [Granulicella sibirica]
MRVVRWLVGFVVAVVVLLGVAVYLLGLYPLRELHPSPMQARGVLAITGANVYVSPDAPVMARATVVVRDGKIAAVGEGVEVPAGAEVIACDGCVVTAGFWNAHVHFTEAKWIGAEWKPKGVLEAQVEDMLTSRGFTTVVDTGSNLRDTVPLRRRIEHGEILGPKIYTAGGALYPPKGIPYYLRGSLPGWMLRLMAQPATPAAAVKDVDRNIADGADILKLFTGSYVERGTVLPMPVEIATAAVEAARAHGQIAFAHESDLAGVKVAMASGVSVLAHAVDTTEGVDDAVLRDIIARKMAMVPTLKMFRTTVTTKASYLDPIYAQVRRFHELGGDLIFGTDVGYMTDYDTADEFQALAKSGLNGRDMLRMLTVTPATRFGVSAEKGTLEVGKDGDLVVMNGDPMTDVGAFARPKMTVRGGRVIWRR